MRFSGGGGLGAMLALLAAGCTGDAEAEPEGPAATVRDSAGVRIVEYGDVSSVVAPFGLAAEPVFRVGWNPGEREWGIVMRGALLSGGRAAIADGQAREVVILAADGSVERVLGGPGEGPGELGSIFTVTVVGEDTVVVQESFGRRLTLFHAGALLRTLEGEPRFQTQALSGDGAGGLLLGDSPSGYSPTFEEPWLQVPLARLDLATGAVDTVAMADFAPNLHLDRNQRWPVVHPFRAWGHTAAWPGGFVTGKGMERALTRLSPDGAVTQLVRWQSPDATVTPELWDAFEARTREQADFIAAQNVPPQFREPPGGWDAYISAVKELPVGPLPIFMELLADPDGNAWMADYAFSARLGVEAAAPRYRIVSPEGDWLGSVAVPAGVRLLAIGRDHVLGVERNELDVDAVSLWRIERRP